MKNTMLALAALAAFSSAAVEFSVFTDRGDAAGYKCGEKTVFTVTALDKGKALTNGVVVARLDWCGGKKLFEKKIDLAAGNPFKIEGKLDEPGFLRLSVSGLGGSACYSSAYEPLKLRKGSPSPADFDSFWAEARARLAREVPLDAQMVKVAERSTKAFDFYRISFASFGRRVYGYMSVPTDKSRAPYPVLLEVSAAGFGGWTNDMSGSADSIKVFFSVYPFEPNWKWKELGLEKTTYKVMDDEFHRRYGTRYCQAGISDGRESYFFYPVILGIDRAVDWIAARPDVDRSRFLYKGTSQGGGFGFYLTGLNRNFTRAAMFVPAITDTMGYLKGRQSGWPSIVESNSRSPEQRAAAEKWAPYFDGANFASRIRCPVRVVVGLADNTCPPAAVYSAYNEIKVRDKSIYHGIGMGHGCRQELYSQVGAWLTRGSDEFSMSAEGLELVWADEFDGPEIDRSKWIFERGFVRNHEPQWYCEAKKNARIENGALVIEAHEERVKNPNYNPTCTNDWPEAKEYAEYTSAALESRGKFSFKYGRLDVRAKMPWGRAVWPAIWTMGVEKGWPACGEIDLVEYYGFIPGDPQGCFHWRDQAKAKNKIGHVSSGCYHSGGRVPSDGFHLYTMEWTAEKVVFRYDGEIYGEYDVARANQPDGSNPFRQPHYILLNLALKSASWDGKCKYLSDTAFPQRFEIDYVRVYKTK